MIFFFAKYDSEKKTDFDLIFSKKIAHYLNKNLIIDELKLNTNSPDELISSVHFVASNTEELISDYTFCGYIFQLSKSAQSKGYKVMLSGMGGDEAFAGYSRYLILKKHHLINLMAPILRLAFKLKMIPKKFDKRFERLLSYTTKTIGPLLILVY